MTFERVSESSLRRTINNARHPKTLINLRDNLLFGKLAGTNIGSSPYKNQLQSQQDELNKRLLITMTDLHRFYSPVQSAVFFGGQEIQFETGTDSESFEHILKYYEPLEVCFLPKKSVSEICIALGGSGKERAITYLGLPIISEEDLETVLDEKGEEEKKQKVRLIIEHEKKHVEYSIIHGQKQANSNNAILTNELYAYFSSFVDLNGSAGLADTGFADFVNGKLTEAYKSIDPLNTDAICRLGFAITVLNTLLQISSYTQPLLAYLKTLTTLDQIISTYRNPLGEFDELSSLILNNNDLNIPLNHLDAYHAQFLSFKRAFEQQESRQPASS